jgi:2,5-diamino-6-(ribosylamino)-4(3H)-pyrimidinone 5'-phosphate reductase
MPMPSTSAPEFLRSTLSHLYENSDKHSVHVTLTFAQSLDAKIAGVGGKQLILSGKESMIMTHWFILIFNNHIRA